MEASLPLSTTSYSKSDKRSKSKNVQSTSITSLVLAFLSCLAWLYVAGRSVVLKLFFFLLFHTLLRHFLLFNELINLLFLPSLFDGSGVSLWQDTENRKLLENLLRKNSNQVWFLETWKKEWVVLVYYCVSVFLILLWICSFSFDCCCVFIFLISTLN